MTIISDERVAEMRAWCERLADKPWYGEGDKSPKMLTTVDFMIALVLEVQSLRAQGGMRVKPLEWGSEPPYFVARVPMLRLLYSVEAIWDDCTFRHVELRGGFATGDFSTVAEAKAAAQADYERRILSSLEASPAEGESND